MYAHDQDDPAVAVTRLLARHTAAVEDLTDRLERLEAKIAALPGRSA